MTTEQEKSPWDTELGLPNDIDGYIASAKFGTKDEYAQAVAATGSEGGKMIIFDLEDKDGELVGSPGYSIGSGWIVDDDGQSISHPKRTNVVTSSVYGQLMNRVVKDLEVDMVSRGLPTEAKSWVGLGFHWMQQEHATVGGTPASQLMPVEYIGERKAGAAPAATAAAKATPASQSTADKALALLARTNELEAFQEKALSLPSVASNDELMAQVLDSGDEGYWATHHTS